MERRFRQERKPVVNNNSHSGSEPCTQPRAPTTAHSSSFQAQQSQDGALWPRTFRAVLLLVFVRSRPPKDRSASHTGTDELRVVSHNWSPRRQHHNFRGVPPAVPGEASALRGEQRLRPCTCQQTDRPCNPVGRHRHHGLRRSPAGFREVVVGAAQAPSSPASRRPHDHLPPRTHLFSGGGEGAPHGLPKETRRRRASRSVGTCTSSSSAASGPSGHCCPAGSATTNSSGPWKHIHPSEEARDPPSRTTSACSKTSPPGRTCAPLR